MTNVQWLLAAVLMQHVLFGVLWLGAARLRLARRPAAHWAAMALTVATGLSVLMLRGEVAHWLSVGVGNLLILLALLMLRRGVQSFCRLPPTDREHAGLLALGVVGLLGTALPGEPLMGAVLLAATAMVWTLLRAAGEIRSGLAVEFGTRGAFLSAMPLTLLACLLLVRVGIALVFPQAFANYLNQPGAGGVVPAFATLVFTLLLQVSLVLMVTLRLVRRLQYQSDHDMLTGLLGRRPMTERLEVELLRQQRHGGHCALLSVDIDHFKRINDEHGHATGDAVLRRVAHCLQEAARRVDSVARMGGEEFCVLLPGADRASAERVAARMLEAVRLLQHPEMPGDRRVSISIGLAVTEQPGEPVQGLQRRLDQALYRAKAAGRDCVRHAEAPADGVPGAGVAAAV